MPAFIQAKLKEVLSSNPPVLSPSPPLTVDPSDDNPLRNALVADTALDISKIQIDTNFDHSEVYLSGTVNSQEAKVSAEKDVFSVPGVKHVFNNLYIRPELSEWVIEDIQGGDGKIALELSNSLLAGDDHIAHFLWLVLNEDGTKILDSHIYWDRRFNLAPNGQVWVFHWGEEKQRSSGSWKDLDVFKQGQPAQTFLERQKFSVPGASDQDDVIPSDGKTDGKGHFYLMWLQRGEQQDEYALTVMNTAHQIVSYIPGTRTQTPDVDWYHSLPDGRGYYRSEIDNKKKEFIVYYYALGH